jgi:hypothetical protein
VGGAADLVSAVYRQTILQSYVPDGFQGRIQGVFIAVVAGGPRLGDLRAGAAAAVMGPTAAWVSGGVCACVVAVCLAAAFPALRRYQPVRVAAAPHVHTGPLGGPQAQAVPNSP